MKEQRPRCTESPSLFTNLPEELIPPILLRLPVRSLLRFKSVCKSWLSLISDPQFGKSHFDLAASPTYRYIAETNDSCSEIKSLDINASFQDESSVVQLKFPLPFPPEEISTGYNDRSGFMGSCRGFILVAYQCGNTIIWNPSTGAERRIPEADGLAEPTFQILTGFGYDGKTDDYLLVHILMEIASDVWKVQVSTPV